jgi:hypothetical protein
MFETFPIDPNVYYALSTYDFMPTADFEGSRTKAYYTHVVHACQMVDQQRYIPKSVLSPFSFQDDWVLAANTSLALSDSLRCLVDAPFYQSICDFQSGSVQVWRGKQSRAKLLVPTVSLEDETTSCGLGKVILSLMEMFGILEATETDGVDGYVRHLRLAEGYEAKFLCVFGDGLTQIRVNGFKDKIETAAFSFEL